MPEQLITHKIRLGLSECAEKRGETLADDFYVTVSIGDEGPEGPQRICTLRELLMEEAKLSGCLENELRLPPQIARFRGVAKHADDAALHVHREYQTWGGENESRPDPRKFVGRDKVIWDAMLSAGRQALLEHGLTVSEEALADAYYAMIKRGDKEIMKHAHRIMGVLVDVGLACLHNYLIYKGEFPSRARISPPRGGISAQKQRRF